MKYLRKSKGGKDTHEAVTDTKVGEHLLPPLVTLNLTIPTFHPKLVRLDLSVSTYQDRYFTLYMSLNTSLST